MHLQFFIISLLNCLVTNDNSYENENLLLYYLEQFHTLVKFVGFQIWSSLFQGNYWSWIGSCNYSVILLLLFEDLVLQIGHETFWIVRQLEWNILQLTIILSVILLAPNNFKCFTFHKVT